MPPRSHTPEFPTANSPIWQTEKSHRGVVRAHSWQDWARCSLQQRVLLVLRKRQTVAEEYLGDTNPG